VLWKKGPVASNENMAWELLWRDMIRPLLEREGKRKVTVEMMVEDAEDNIVEAKLGLPFEDEDELEGIGNANSVAEKKRKRVAMPLRTKNGEEKGVETEHISEDGEAAQRLKAPTTLKPKRVVRKKR
jgi:hypothetical protein